MTIAKQWVKQWARKLQLAFLALAGALVLTACASPQPTDYAQEKPVLDLKEYFNGTIDAWGVFQDRSGKVVKRFTVVMKCTWDGNTGVLDEDFTYSDGTTQKRVWTLKKDGNKYTGTAGDVLGQANGETSGNAFQWKYTMLLPVDGTTYEVQFDDWILHIKILLLILRCCTICKLWYTGFLKSMNGSRIKSI